MTVAMIGENAGLIWNALQGGALTSKALKKATKLKAEEFNQAIGWLGQKIAFFCIFLRFFLLNSFFFRTFAPRICK